MKSAVLDFFKTFIIFFAVFYIVLLTSYINPILQIIYFYESTELYNLLLNVLFSTLTLLPLISFISYFYVFFSMLYSHKDRYLITLLIALISTILIFFAGIFTKKYESSKKGKTAFTYLFFDNQYIRRVDGKSFLVLKASKEKVNILLSYKGLKNLTINLNEKEVENFLEIKLSNIFFSTGEDYWVGIKNFLQFLGKDFFSIDGDSALNYVIKTIALFLLLVSSFLGLSSLFRKLSSENFLYNISISMLLGFLGYSLCKVFIELTRFLTFSLRLKTISYIFPYLFSAVFFALIFLLTLIFQAIEKLR